MRVLLIAPHVGHRSTGEAYVAWCWANALSHIVDLTLFSLVGPDQHDLEASLPRARVITRPLPTTFSRFKRFDAMAKPEYFAFYRHARSVVESLNSSFDVCHQLMPQAARYPSPLVFSKAPYVLGPYGGSLPTPPSFRSEFSSSSWFTYFRALDRFRFRWDPWLRHSLAGADLVLGVAPYMEQVLRDIPLKRFEPVLELGIQDLPTLTHRISDDRRIRLLHVGRGVRSKGLRDAVRALAIAIDLVGDSYDLTLDSAGEGEEIGICRDEAQRLGVLEKVTFHGQLPRAEVEKLYSSSDIFLFPSFREPAGNVLYEAMRWGLPVITAARGGPDWIVNDDTGIRVPVVDPRQFAEGLSTAIQTLVINEELRMKMGLAARAKLEAEGLWQVKAASMLVLYKEILKSYR